MKKIILIYLFIQSTFLSQTGSITVSNYNVSWNSPSKNYNGSMPIGNGDIGLNVWVEENGDLLFYIGKTDSWDGNGRLLKIGKIRIKLSPLTKYPLQNFNQTLHLENSTIDIKYNDNKIKLWVDANNPVVNVEIESSEIISLNATIELWRNSQYQLPSIEISDVMYDHNSSNKQIAPTIVEPDSILNFDNKIGWFHVNNKSIGPTFTANQQGLQNFKRVDPLLNRIFGGIITSENPIKIDKKNIQSKNSTKHRFSIYLLTEHPSTPQKWIDNLDSTINKIEKVSIEQRFQQHCFWWNNFWERSWIDISANNSNQKDEEEAFIVSQTYALQRFINACNGRGKYPIKFNGAIFNVPFKDAPGDADYRRWGPGYWWQNTRLPYYSMPTSGDYEMMLPLFKMYAKENMELFKYRTKLYLNVYGAFIPECIYFWGDIFSESYGLTPFENRTDKLQESGWHKYEWVSGLELVYLMLDYFEYTNDEEFLSEYVLPTSKEIISFFDNFYKTENGILIMEPSQSGETWWKCLNPMPELAGLHSVINRLLNINSDKINSEMVDFWESIKSKLPDLPIHEKDGIKMLAPAETFENKMNIENTELYSVFPFQLIIFNSENKQLAIDAFKYRLDKGNWGWRQDDIFASYLGLVETTKKYLFERAKNKNVDSRFPAFWGPNYDWTPDQTHGGVLMKTLQSMILQANDDKIYLLPTWPKEWNVKFKLNAPNQTVIEGNYTNSKLEIIKIIPDYRKSDIVFVN
ncbi:MAG: DUF5703 domain-containing protein [Melioribacteraceae bacterium]